jgi:pimeloyl-ACP methyl ester carboxylesterase
MKLNKTALYLLVLHAVFQLSYGQSKKINYGKNPIAGKYYSIRGFKMYCEIYGQGKPLLMIHGNGGNIAAFTKNIPYFSKTYKVIIPDSRAQGKSIDNQDSLSFEMMADDFATLLDTLGIDKSYVIGWSDGGINALLLAMRHPEKVIKLVSTGANLWPDSTAIIPSDWKDEQAYYDSSKNKTWTSAKDKNDWKIFLLDWFQPNISLSALKAVKCPALIICGDHDVITLEHTVLIYQNVPKAFLWVLPNSGHGTLIEHTNEFNKKAHEFFTNNLSLSSH